MTRFFTFVTALVLAGAMTPAARADFLFVGEDNGSIVRYDTTNGSSSTFANIGGGVRGLAFDGSGNLFASNTNNTIEKITPGGVVSVFASTGLSAPQGLAFDGAGNLFVANFGSDTIEKFAPGGAGNLFATTPSGPAALAIQPSTVPEPSSLAMVGLGIIGVAGYLRRRKAH